MPSGPLQGVARATDFDTPGVGRREMEEIEPHDGEIEQERLGLSAVYTTLSAGLFRSRMFPVGNLSANPTMPSAPSTPQSPPQ